MSTRSAWLALVAILTSGCATVSAPSDPPSGAIPPFVHDDFDAFLSRHVDEAGRVDYVAAQGDRDDLARYLSSVARGSPDNAPGAFPTEADRLAYWLNAYNAWTISLVLDRYPVGSVHEIQTGFSRILAPILPDGAGFFLFQRIELGRARTSLYALENSVVRARFDEPRIHFALNCASGGCPRLPRTAFRGESLESELARETRRFLAEERNASVDADRRVVRLSSIFDWYAADFTGWMERNHPDEPATLIGWVTRHSIGEGEGERRDGLLECADCRLEFVPYDWDLNDLVR